MAVSNEEKEELRELIIRETHSILNNTTLVSADIDKILQCLQPVTVDFSDWQKIVQPVNPAEPLPYKPMDVFYTSNQPTPIDPSKPMCTDSFKVEANLPNDHERKPWHNNPRYRVKDTPLECVSPTPDEIGG